MKNAVEQKIRARKETSWKKSRKFGDIKGAESTING